MNLPKAILTKTLARFDSLIAEGRNILESASGTDAGDKKPDAEKLFEWRTKAATLLVRVIPKSHVHREAAESLAKLPVSSEALQEAVSMLRGIKDDLDKGFLDDLSACIEAEIATDYMGQAEHLLAEGHRGKFDHVPAAVLAGAVLEKALHTLCGQQQPPIPLKGPKGEFKSLTPLINDLKKAGVFNEAKAKQLQAWAALRNLAAHGEFGQFKRGEVEHMITGINGFLADYLK
jgi:hypothetical protein